MQSAVAGFGGATSREEQAFGWGLVVPLVALVLGLKAWRVAERGELVAWWSPLELMRSDLLIVVAFWLFGWALLRSLMRRRRGRMLALAGLQIGAIGWAAVEVGAHHFYRVTGTTIDFHLLAFALGRFEETWSVMTSEVGAGTLGSLGLVVAIFCGLPWLVWWRTDEREGPQRAGSWGRRALAAGSAVGCVALAMVPAAGEDSRDFGRANLVNMAVSLGARPLTPQDMETVARRPLNDLRLQGPGAEEGPKNVAIIILESTRAQSLTVHNPELETTPFLAQLANKSTVADRAYAVVPHTSKALVATLCGLEPRLRMPITEAVDEGLPARCLAALLGDMGYRTMFMQSATERFENRPGLVENMGYDDFIPLEMMDRQGFEEANYFGLEDAVMLEPSRQWLQEHGDQPFLATYLTLTPHHDYLAPRRFGNRQFDVEDEELNRYLNTLHYVDQFTEQLMDQYRELGLYEDTLFVIIGDHGEGFEEHGRSQHDNVIWEPGIHVPFLIYDPSQPQAQRLKAPVSQIDLVPTVVDWLGYEAVGGSWPGMPIEDSDEDRVVYAHCWYERRCMARVGARFKYIDHFSQRGVEVYDLVADPGEQHNLADAMADEVGRWRAQTYGWRESVNAVYRAEHRDQVAEALVDGLPDDAQPLEFEIGPNVRHRGYRIDGDDGGPFRRGQRVRITQYFEVLEPLGPGWQLFAHGQGVAGMINLDHVPVDGLHPVDEWQAQTMVADDYSFRIPRDWEGDKFSLYVGIFHPEQGRAAIGAEVETDGDRRALVLERPVE